MVLSGIHRPVELVAMPGGVSATGFLEQGLIVVHAHTAAAHQSGGNTREACGKRQRLRQLVPAPEVDYLGESLPIGIPFFQRDFSSITFPGQAADRAADRIQSIRIEHARQADGACPIELGKL